MRHSRRRKIRNLTLLTVFVVAIYIFSAIVILFHIKLEMKCCVFLCLLPHILSALCRNCRMLYFNLRSSHSLHADVFHERHWKRTKVVRPPMPCFHILSNVFRYSKFNVEKTSGRSRAIGTICQVYWIKDVGWNVKVGPTTPFFLSFRHVGREDECVYFLLCVLFVTVSVELYELVYCFEA
jgi:hypothetical protein